MASRLKIANLCPKSNGCQVLRYILFSRENNCKFLYTADVSTGLSEIANLSRSVSPAWRDNPKILGQMVNDPYRVYRRKIPNRNFRNFFINGKQPLS